jgi:hypothetical protein
VFSKERVLETSVLERTRLSEIRHEYRSAQHEQHADGDEEEEEEEPAHRYLAT